MRPKIRCDEKSTVLLQNFLDLNWALLEMIKDVAQGVQQMYFLYVKQVRWSLIKFPFDQLLDSRHSPTKPRITIRIIFPTFQIISRFDFFGTPNLLCIYTYFISRCIANSRYQKKYIYITLS
jgi:hypothetical protein